MGKDKENEKLEPADLAGLENELLRGLLEAAEDIKDTTKTIEIVRGGKVYFRFKIRALNEKDYYDAREKATTYSRKNKVGMRLPEDTDSTLYHSWVIYTATVPEDRDKLWNNKVAQNKLGVMGGPHVIENVLLAGEKEAIAAKIDELSGFAEEIEKPNLEEIAKN